MKIVDVNIRELKVPLKHAYALSKAYGVQTTTCNIVVEIVTDNGVSGWGECDPWAEFTGDTGETVISLLKGIIGPRLIGMDPTDIMAIHALMDSSLRGNHTAKACIDVACYDILGKTYGAPVYKFIGGKLRDSVKCFWAVGGGTADETAKAVADVKARGFYGCMIKVGNNYRIDAERTLAAREAVGDAFPLIADANQGWDVRTAILYGRAVEKVNLLFLEQPVKYTDINGLAKIRQSVSMPISADESVTTIQDAEQLVRFAACDYFSVKVSKNGGIAPMKRICDFAADAGVDVFFNSMHEEGITQSASLHVACTVSNLLAETGHSFFSTMRLDGDITDFKYWTEDGVTKLRNRPGLGFEINWDNLEKYTVRSCSVLR